MRDIKSIRIIAFLLLIFGAACSSKIPSPADFKVDLPVFNKPKVNEWSYANGLRVVHFYYPELPLVNVSLISKRGRLYGADFSDGIKTATISLLKDGGAGNLNAEQLDEKLDSLATSIAVGQDNNSTSVEMSCLSENLQESVDLFSDVIFKPKFDNNRFLLWKSLVADGISRRKESKETLAELSFSNVMFNGEAPWYSPLTEDALSKIKINDLKNYHNNLFTPAESILFFVGAVSEEEIKKIIEKDFYKWEATSNNSLKDIVKLPFSMDPGIYILNSPFEQAEVEMGYLSEKTKNADPYEQALFNKSFGQGSFSSLLFQEIRDKLGLAYEVAGGFEPDKRLDLFRINIGTKSEQAIKSIEEILKLLDKIKKEGIPADSLEEARTSSLQTYIFKFANPDTLAKRDTLIELYGLPKEWDEAYQSKISAVSGDQIQNFIKKFVTPEELKIVIVGNVNIKDVKEKFPDKKVCEIEFSELPKVKGCI